MMYTYKEYIRSITGCHRNNYQRVYKHFLAHIGSTEVGYEKQLLLLDNLFTQFIVICLLSLQNIKILKLR